MYVRSLNYIFVAINMFVWKQKCSVFDISLYCNTVLTGGELTDVIKYTAVPFAELLDLCPPVLESSHSRVKLVKSKLPRTQVRTLCTWYWETAHDSVLPSTSSVTFSTPLSITWSLGRASQNSRSFMFIKHMQILFIYFLWPIVSLDNTFIHCLVSFVALWSCTETVFFFYLQPFWSPLKLTMALSQMVP